jgi:Zn-dependent M28 family amino/carboxypeptidase
MGCVAVWLTALGLAASKGPSGWWAWVTLAGVLTGAPVVVSWVGDVSPGALDNASGVAAVMIAAARVPAAVPLGVVLTSAEELGLAGARAWARAAPRPSGGVVLNCDGVDDSGYLKVMYSGARPERAFRAFAGARPGRLPLGVLVDALAFSGAGWDAVTLSRGTVATWGRIHSTRDTADRLTGAGVDSTATALATAAQALA